MTDEKIPPDNSTLSPDTLPSSSPEPRQPTGSTTGDLRTHAEKALRLLRDAGVISDTMPMMAAGDEGPENTTHDLKKAAREAVEMALGQQRLERAARTHTTDSPDMPFPAGMLLRLDVLESTTPMVLDVRGDMIIGRSDNVTSYTPEIDMTRYGAYRLGLSRRHAILRRSGEYLELVDLGSRNGTHVNGHKLNPGETRRVKDGDEIQLGNLTLQLSFQPA
ncbi:MAG: FHA domain-containing protein [Anaerolineae bacterium]|jgi:hypothetical protein|nr:FHA domain-containing protein [Anaerolineae bacterium]